MNNYAHSHHQMPAVPASISSQLRIALAHLSQGQVAQARSIYEQILRGPVPHPDALSWMGVIEYQAGQAERGLLLIRRAIDIHPSNPTYHTTLGNVLQGCGLLIEAETAYKAALAIQPLNAELLNNLGCLLLSQGMANEAIRTFQKAIGVRPAYVEAYCNLGNAFKAAADFDAAINSYLQALQIKPGFPEALSNLGMAYFASGRLSEAIVAYKKALSLRNPFPEASYNLGLAQDASGRRDDAINSWMNAVAARKKYPEAYIHLGNAFHSQGELEKARDCYQQANQNGEFAGLYISAALMLPPVMGSKNEVLESRAKFERNLDALIQEGLTIKDPIKEYCNTNFYLAYHGLNDRDIQEKIAKFYEQACPKLKYNAPTTSSPLRTNGKIRVGFLSKYIYTHSVSQCYSQVVIQLAERPEFEIVLIAIDNASTRHHASQYSGFVGESVYVKENLEETRATVTALNLDVLVYMDLGMDPFSYFLAYSRLAKVQCVLDGHPVTSGIPAIDYFLTCDAAETDDAANSYSESLIRLKFGAFYYERPVPPPHYKSRTELRLPESGGLYICPMTLQKIHPDFDAALEGILKEDEMGHIVFFSDKHNANWQSMLESRFERTIAPSLRGRIVFLPWVTNYQDFMCFMQAADVILDPFHFGIGVTAVAALSVGTPFVTKPSNFARGRYGLYYSAMLDTMECVVDTTEEYIARAVAIARTPSLRPQIKSKILVNNDRLFENKQGIDELAAFFKTHHSLPVVLPTAAAIT